MNRVNVLFVCLANICRSPTAEAVFNRSVFTLNIPHNLKASSAGTSNVRAGHPADTKASKLARKKGYELLGHTARIITNEIANDADYIIAVDTYNLLELKEKLPKQLHSKMHLLLDFGRVYKGMDIPDPYKRSTKAYTQALDLIEYGVEELIQHIRLERKF